MFCSRRHRRRSAGEVRRVHQLALPSLQFVRVDRLEFKEDVQQRVRAPRGIPPPREVPPARLQQRARRVHRGGVSRKRLRAFFEKRERPLGVERAELHELAQKPNRADLRAIELSIDHERRVFSRFIETKEVVRRRFAKRVDRLFDDFFVKRLGRALERRQNARKKRRRGRGGVGLPEALALDFVHERLRDQPPRDRPRGEVAECRGKRVGVGVTRPRAARAQLGRNGFVEFGETTRGLRRFRALRKAFRGGRFRREQTARHGLAQRGEALVEGAGDFVVPERGVAPFRARVHAARKKHVTLFRPRRVVSVGVVDFGRHTNAARLASQRLRENLEVPAQRLARLLELGDAQRERLGELTRPRQNLFRLALGVFRRAPLVKQSDARRDVERTQSVAERAAALGGQAVVIAFIAISRREPVTENVLLFPHERVAVRLGERRQRREDVREVLFVAPGVGAPNQLRHRREDGLRGFDDTHQVRLREQAEPRATQREAIVRGLRRDENVFIRSDVLLPLLRRRLFAVGGAYAREGAFGRVRAYRARQHVSQRLAELGIIHPVQQRHNFHSREYSVARRRFDRRRRRNGARVLGDVL